MNKINNVFKFYAAIQERHRNNILYIWGCLKASPIERSEQIKKLDIIANVVEQMKFTTDTLLKFVESENVEDEEN